jgi:hypothetical protein
VAGFGATIAARDVRVNPSPLEDGVGEFVLETTVRDQAGGLYTGTVNVAPAAAASAVETISVYLIVP